MNINKLLKRKIEIVTILSHFSRDGWKTSIPADYEPLERELRQIQNDLDQARRIRENNQSQLRRSIDRNGAMEP